MGEDKKKPEVTTEVSLPEKEELLAMDKDKLVDMFLRLNEGKDYIQMELMTAVVANERNIKIIKHLDYQLRIKDVFIEAVLDSIGWDKLPDGMELYSGEGYVHFWEDENNIEKASFNEGVEPKEDGKK